METVLVAIGENQVEVIMIFFHHQHLFRLLPCIEDYQRVRSKKNQKHRECASVNLWLAELAMFWKADSMGWTRLHNCP